MNEFEQEDAILDFLSSTDSPAIRRYCTEHHPATVAEQISRLDETRIWTILHLLEVSHRADVFSHLALDQQVELATGENRHGMARLLEEMAPDERADLVQRLDSKVCEEILPLVVKAEREDIRKLLSYAERTAGAVMTTDYATVRPQLTIAQALEQLRGQAPGRETIYYIYVVDNRQQLLGVVSLKDLILGRPGQTIQEIMNPDVITVGVNDDQEHVAREIEKYDLIAIPVTDPGGALVGIITHDDAIDILRQEQQEDVEKFMAISGSHAAGEYLKTSSWVHFKKRVIWVVVLAVVGLVSGLIIQNFEDVLAQLVILTAFMPMLADTGGNTGSQAATLVVRALALKEIRPGDALKVIFKELRVSVMLASVLAVVAFGRVLLIGGGSRLPSEFTLIQIGAAIAVALSIQVVSATLIGALLPLGAARLKLDPAVVASPALTTCVDISGLLIYFTTVRLMLGI
jgi:magnesium transporter